jgi:hypothetical protein
MRGVALVLGLTLSLALSAGTAAAEPPRAAEPSAEAARELLRQAIDLYVVGRYQQAAERLRPLLETRVLQDRADQREALRAYGISLFLSGARAGAARAFRDLLRIESGARLDPSFVRPEVVSFFEEVRAQHAAEQTELLRKRGPKHSAAVNLLPPWGQFKNGHRRKGYVILTGEVVFAATSLATAALLRTWEGSDRLFLGHEDAYRPLLAANYASFAALVALIGYGIVDGLYHYYRVPKAEKRKMGSSAPIERWPRHFPAVSF